MHIIPGVQPCRPKLTLWIERWLEEHESLAIVGFWLLPQMVYVTIALMLGNRLGWLKWPLIAVIALFAVRWLVKRERDQHARKLVERICLHCGYDLRASPDRCPECGQPVALGSGPMSVGGRTFLSAINLNDLSRAGAPFPADKNVRPPEMRKTGMSAPQ